ncbi:MAG: DUF1080 domain-containing protein [Planctomycetota bacterium]
MTLTWRDPFDAWTSKGWELVNAELPDKGAEAFTITPGNSALVNTGFPASGFVSKAEFGDIEFRFRFMMPKGGDSGLYFMGRYELQLNDDPWGCLGVIHGKNPRAKGYRGPGEWHEVSGKFFAPRFDADGKKIVNARFDQIQADGVMVIGSCEVGEITAGGVGKDEVAEGPLFFQGSAGRVAIGDVRVRRIVEGEEAHDGGGWTAWDGASRSQGGSFELRGDLNLSDQGGSVLWLAENGGEGLRLVLDHTSSAEARTGSLRGAEFQEGDGLIRTQLLQPEIDFDLLVRVTRGADSAHVEVFLNGLRMQSLHTTAPLAPGNLRLESERIPGTVLKVQNLEIRSR